MITSIYNRQFRSSIISHQENKQLALISENIQCKNLDKIYVRGKCDEKGHVISSVLAKQYPKFIRVSDLREELK